MRRPVLVLDLETIEDMSLPPRKPKGKKKKADEFPPVPYHQIVAMGAALLDAHYHLRKIWIVAEGKSEEEMLRALTGFLNAHFARRDDIMIAGWNTRGFDMPVIAARCLRYGISFPWYYGSREVRYRYSPDGHLDLMEFLVDYSTSRNYSLDIAAKLIGMPGKMDCSGANVGKMIAEGRQEEVFAYCMTDVAQETAVFLRTQLLRGELAHAEYVAAMEGLLLAVEREPRLAPMLPLIDRGRLLLTPAAGPVQPKLGDGAPDLGQEPPKSAVTHTGPVLASAPMHGEEAQRLRAAS